MPDRYGFDHLPDRGYVTHRCIEEGCGWPPEQRAVAERERERHHREHERARQAVLDRRRRDALAQGRQLRRLVDRENGQVSARSSS